MTGSYSHKDHLQLWSWDSEKIAGTIPWSESADSETGRCYIYSSLFSKGQDNVLGTTNRYIIAGGAGAGMNEMKIFDSESHRAIGLVRGLVGGIYSVDISHNGKIVALGGSGRGLMIFDWDDKTEYSRMHHKYFD